MRLKVERGVLAGFDEHANVFHLNKRHYGLWFEFRKSVWYGEID